MHDADAGALLAGATGAAAAVCIVLDIVGHTVVDDVGQVIYIEAAGSYVGGHEQLNAMLAEALHREVALLLREVAVESVGVVAVLYEFVGNLLRLEARAAENDGVDLGIVVDYTFQREVFVARVYHIIYMVDVLSPFVATAYDDLPCFVEVVLCYALYLAAHSGREE